MIDPLIVHREIVTVDGMIIHQGDMIGVKPCRFEFTPGECSGEPCFDYKGLHRHVSADSVMIVTIEAIH